ncbi:hypothetical protein [Pseudoalteromonas sp. Of7M-16]|uniref:hypothetical protein n=1 Tax=Pseudoalteromonas sp. Of7M-16 TaxID=2917756 RepID=UPI001EF482CD|nr:hypothetical protein [Pseudoalteromonas sp. Of7M-16]MCG7551267.1 hypothetical protein [Pseudoalteromonas sp. Of7M-16]
MFFVTTRLEGGKQVPVGACKFCQMQYDVNFRELVNGDTAVSMPAGDGSSTVENAEHRNRENSIRNLLGELEFKCIPTYTNSGSGLILKWYARI